MFMTDICRYSNELTFNKKDCQDFLNLRIYDIDLVYKFMLML